MPDNKIKSIWPFNLVAAINVEWLDEVSIDGIMKALSKLEGRDRAILFERYKNYQTYDAIASQFGITRERVRQIIMNQLRVLKKPGYSNLMRSVSLDEYKELEMKHAALENTFADFQEKYCPDENVEDVDKNHYNHILDNTGIDECGFSVRLFNVLYRAGIRTVMEAAILSEEDYLKMRNFGQKCFTELEGKLKEYGLHINYYGVNHDELYMIGVTSTKSRLNCYKCGIKCINDLIRYTPDELVRRNIASSDMLTRIMENLAREGKSLAPVKELEDTHLSNEVIHVLHQIGVKDIDDLIKCNKGHLRRAITRLYGANTAEQYLDNIDYVFRKRGTPIAE